jgi:hypothetical protein
LVDEVEHAVVQGHAPSAVVKKELHCAHVQAQGQRLEERDELRHEVAVPEIQLKHDDLVHVVVGQQVIERGLVPHVLHKDGDGLDDLRLHDLVAPGGAHHVS